MDFPQYSLRVLPERKFASIQWVFDGMPSGRWVGSPRLSSLSGFRPPASSQFSARTSVGRLGGCGDSCVPRRHTPLHAPLTHQSRICWASLTPGTWSSTFPSPTKRAAPCGNSGAGTVPRRLQGRANSRWSLAPFRRALVWPVLQPCREADGGLCWASRWWLRTSTM